MDLLHVGPVLSFSLQVHHAGFAEVLLAGLFLLDSLMREGEFLVDLCKVLHASMFFVLLVSVSTVLLAGLSNVFLADWFLTGFPDVFFTGWFLASFPDVFLAVLHADLFNILHVELASVLHVELIWT